MGKHKWNSKQAWLDWLSDDPPAPSAQAELRERFKQQANSYQPVNRSRPQPYQPPVAPQAPFPGQQTAQQAQVVSNTTPVLNTVPGAAPSPKQATPATVSIQIHIPAFSSARFKKLLARARTGRDKLTGWITQGIDWARDQYAENRLRTIGVAAGAGLLLLGLFIPPLLHFGSGKDKTGAGAAASASAGGVTAPKYEKPPFEVVRPSNKPKLGTPDGVHAAYDGTKNNYSYSDSIGGNGFTVSQQPIPPQFTDGTTAVETISATVVKGATPVKLKVLTGSAYVSTNTKYNSQVVVANVRDILLFIQSAHAFKNSEWENYINTLQ